MKIFLIDGGYCVTQSGVLNGSSITTRGDVNVMYCYFEHDEYKCLFDTGYTIDFATVPYPEKLYHLITKVPIKQFETRKQIFNPLEINYVFISHYHPDHISGLKQFPNAKFVALEKPIKKLLSGYIKQLFPDNFLDRLIIVDKIHNFFDFFDDGKVKIVPLTGHCKNHMGVILDNRVFLVGDAVWCTDNYQKLALPSKITNWIQEDYKEYIKNIHNIRKLSFTSPQLQIIPSHCPSIYAKLRSQPYIELQNRQCQLIDPKRILITGGTGFIGGRVAELFSKKYDEVTIIGRNKIKAKRIISHCPNIKWINHDLRNELILDTNYDVVIHCAAYCDPRGNKRDFYINNIIGTQNMVNFVKANKVKLFIYISSPSIYFGDNTKDNFNIPESYPPEKKLSHYGKSKLEGEYLTRTLDTPYVILRPRGVFGPNDQNILPILINKLKSKRLPCIGSGDNFIDMTYIDNVVHSIDLSINTPTSWYGAYNITNQEPVKIWKVIDTIADSLDLPKPKIYVPFFIIWLVAWFIQLFTFKFITCYMVNLLGRNCTLDNSLAQTKLNYKPIVSMEQGINLTILSMKD